MVSERRWLAALGAWTFAATGVNAGEPPLRLEVEHEADAATILVVGNSDTPLQAHYALSVDGASTVRQSGAARLRPGERVVVARVRIGAAAPWHAELKVTPADAAPYALTAHGAP